MFYFKKFCDNLNLGAVLRPYRYYLAHNLTGACQLEYQLNNDDTNQSNFYKFNANNSKRLSTINSPFRLFYIFPYNSTHDMTRVYTETTDFKNWNYLTDGKFVNFVEINQSTTKFNPETLFKEPFWTTGMASFGSQNESRVFTIIYPILAKNEENSSYRKNNIIVDNNSDNLYIKNRYSYSKSIQEAKKRINQTTKITKELNYDDDDRIIVTTVGSSFFTESLFLILKQKTQAKNVKYIITDHSYNVIIDNEIGAIYPKYLNNLNIAIFPNISEINNSFWQSIEKEIIEVPNDSPLLVNISSKEYMIIKRVINSRSRYSNYLIMLIDVNEKMTEIYVSITKVFIICAILIFIIYFVVYFLVIYFKSKRFKKLERKKREILSKNDLNKTIDDRLYYGTCINAIQDLRNIQLNNVDNLVLNNLVDDAVEEITRNDDELFNINLCNDSNKNKNKEKINICKCPFCSYLINSDEDLSILKDEEKQMIKKKEIENRRMNKIISYHLNGNDQNDIDDKEIKANDYYIESNEKFNNHLFSKWKIKMNIILNQSNIKELLKTNPQKYLTFKFLKFIQKGNFFFKEYYPDSILLFIMTFSNENISCYHCKIKAFQLMKKLIKDYFKYWIKSKQDIFILFLALILRHSKLKSTNQILNLLKSFVNFDDKYLFNLLKVLIDETKNINVMNIYGQLMNRRQSPNFSVFNNTKDLVLFMKALLCFSDFAPYLTEINENEKCFSEINEAIFSEEEKLDLNYIANFHYEFTKNVVFPWCTMMNSLSELNEIQNELYRNIDYWFTKFHSF